MESSLMLNPDKEISKNVQTSCLIGKIFLGTQLSIHLVKTITTSSWNCKKPFSVSFIDRNIFVFSFNNKDDFINVLLNAPWSINGNLLILSPWASAKTRHEFHFSRSPFWVQVHGLPIEYLTLKNGYEIGRVMGTPIRVDRQVFDEMPQWGKVLRIRVSIDVTKPLKTGFVLRRGSLPGVWVDFKYERLFVFCYSCGRIGHRYKSCKFVRSNAMFGPSLRASMPFDLRYFGTYPRVSRTLKDSIVEVCSMMQTGNEGNCSPGISNSYHWKKFAINSIDSMVTVMNSSIILSIVSRANSDECKWKRLIVIVGYLIYLALKMSRVVRNSGFIEGYVVRVPLTQQSIVAFVEIMIFVVVFLKFLA